MSDERLRELERLWKETGSDDDEVAWLVERVRQGERLDWESYSRLAELNVQAASEHLLARVERGELEREKLELAAYCSHEPARVTLREEVVPPSGLEEWVLGLEVWGRVTVVTALAASARALTPPDDHNEATLSAIDRWIACPCAAHRQQIVNANGSAEPDPVYFAAIVARLADCSQAAYWTTWCRQAVCVGLAWSQEGASPVLEAVRRELVVRALQVGRG